jgi:hypothetical protein
MNENEFQAWLIKELKRRYSGCIVLKTDPTYIQGLPDLLILYKDQWVALEVKRSEKAKRQPNQEYYVGLMDAMSMAFFIYPENVDDVLADIDCYFFGNLL